MRPYCNACYPNFFVLQTWLPVHRLAYRFWRLWWTPQAHQLVYLAELFVPYRPQRVALRLMILQLHTISRTIEGSPRLSPRHLHLCLKLEHS